MVGYCVEKDLH